MVTILQKGHLIQNGPYQDATIISVSKNGWCNCKWDNGTEFSARANWIVQQGKYQIIPC